MAEEEFMSFDLQCETCGANATVRYKHDEQGRVLIEIEHEGCDYPVLSIMCDNPRPLGVITGTT